MNLRTLIITTALVGALGACEAPRKTDVKPPVKTQAQETVKPKSSQRDIGNRGEVMMALQHLDRSAKDKESDSVRKAAQVLQFTGIWPGMTVLELEAGSGYYTDIMSRIVGAEGKVIMQNPAAFDAFLKPEDIDARLKFLPNVRLSKSNFDALDVPDASVDIVTWFLGPHELFFTPKGASSLGNPEKSYSEIFRVLKPGGSFIVLDHVAPTGAPETSGGDTHRIDPATVQSRAEAAGFVLSGKSKVLRNQTDDYSLNVFDPKIRRKTDRFLHKYIKPK